MSYNYCKDHRSGITYVYEVTSQKDENGNRTTNRKLIGRLDDYGNIVPTSGRRGRLPKNKEISMEDGADLSACQKKIEALERQVHELREAVRILQAEKTALIKGMEDLLSQVR